MTSRFSPVLNNPVVAALRDIMPRRVIQNALSLYGAQFGNYLLPLVTVPYLARVLGPDSWGLVVFVQAIGLYIAMVVEYGFAMSATRDIARQRDDPEKLAEIVSGVIGAKLVLAAGVLALVGIVQLLVPDVRETGWLLWIGAAWFVAAAMSPLWFFLGMERVTLFLVIDIGLRALGVGAVLVFVQSPADDWLALGLQGATVLAGTMIGTVLVYRVVPFSRPTIGTTAAALVSGLRLFVFRVSTSVFNMSNVLILGLMAPAPLVAFYAGAERIIRILITGMQPIMQALYPSASSSAAENPRHTARIAKTTAATLFPLGVGGCLMLVIFAPAIIRIALGPGYEGAVPVLRTLSLLLPLISVLFPLTGHWMIPMGLEGLLTKVTVSAGVVHVVLAVVLTLQYSHVGIAWAWVLSELYVLLALTTVLGWRGLSPFSARAL